MGLFALRFIFIITLLCILQYVISAIWYYYFEKYRVVLYGNNMYYIEKKITFCSWTREYYYGYLPFDSEDKAMYQINTIYENIEKSKKAKTRIKTIKYVPKTLAQSKLSDLVKAVNEGRKEDEECIFSEISGYFNG